MLIYNYFYSFNYLFISLFLYYFRAVRDLLISEEISLQEQIFRESATINKEKAVLKECLNNSQLARVEKEVEIEEERRNFLFKLEEDTDLEISNNVRTTKSRDGVKGTNEVESKVENDAVPLTEEEIEIENQKKAENLIKEQARKDAANSVRDWVATLSEPLEEEREVLNEEECLGDDSWGSDRGVRHKNILNHLIVLIDILFFN